MNTYVSHSTWQMYDYCVVLTGNEVWLFTNKFSLNADLWSIRVWLRPVQAWEPAFCRIARIYIKDALETAKKRAKETFGEKYLIVYENKPLI